MSVSSGTPCAKAARAVIADMLEPYGYEVSLVAARKHYRIHCEGPIRAVAQVSLGRHDREITADWARQFAQRVIRRLKEAA